jgi:hypothetical protein
MRTASTWAVAVVLALGVSGTASAQHGPAPAPAAPAAAAPAAPAPSAHVQFTNLNFHQGTASSGKTATHTTHSDTSAHIGNTARQHRSTQGGDNGRGSGGLGSITANASYGGYNYPLGALDFGNSAADQDLAIKALIDPVTEARLALAAREAGYARGTSFVPVYWGAAGGYNPDSPAPQDESSDTNNEPANTDNRDNKQQPQIIVVQPSSQGGNANDAEAEPAPAPQPKLPDVGEFTLVFKDGKKAAAVAYTRQGDRIVYVTKDGARHSVAVDNIDLDATQRVNEASGASFQL